MEVELDLLGKEKQQNVLKDVSHRSATLNSAIGPGFLFAKDLSIVVFAALSASPGAQVPLSEPSE